MTARRENGRGGALRRRRRIAGRIRRDAGARALVYVSARRLAPPRLLVIEWFRVLEHGPARPDHGAGARVTWAGPGDLAFLASLGTPRRVVAERIAAGDRALIGRAADGSPIAFAWYRRGTWRESGVEFDLAPDEVWGYDLDAVETLEARRLLVDLGFAGMRMLAEEGVVRTLAAVDVANRGVQRALLRRGGAPLGSVAQVRVAGVSVRRERWRGAPARWCVYRGSRPVSAPRPPAPRVAPEAAPADDAVAGGELAAVGGGG